MIQAVFSYQEQEIKFNAGLLHLFHLCFFTLLKCVNFYPSNSCSILDIYWSQVQQCCIGLHNVVSFQFIEPNHFIFGRLLFSIETLGLKVLRFLSCNYLRALHMIWTIQKYPFHFWIRLTFWALHFVLSIHHLNSQLIFLKFDIIFLSLDWFLVILRDTPSFIFFHVNFPHTFFIVINISLRFHSIEHLKFVISLHITTWEFYWC